MHLGYICLLLLGLVPSSQLLSVQKDARIHQFITEFLQCSETPGLALGVVKDGVTELATGYGVEDLDTQAPVTGTTLFNIASTSKAFATVLLSLQLQDHPEYNWDTPVREILGDEFYFYNGLASNETMLRDIVSHKTGIPRHDYAWLINALTREQIVERIRFLTPVYPVRTQHQYTNNMYTLTGHVSEQLAGGTSWEELIEQHIFAPLDMSSSTFIYTTLPEKAGHATPYQRINGELIPTPWQMYKGLGPADPAAGISSNAVDMTKWMHFLLGHGPAGVENSFVSETFTPELVNSNTPYFYKPNDPVTMEASNMYCRGWYAGHYRGYKTYSHGGDLRGYHTYVYILPDLDTGIFHTFNLQTTKKQREMVSAFVLDVILGEETWFTAQDVCDAGSSAYDDPDDDSYDIQSKSAGDLHKRLDELPKASVAWNFRNQDYIGLYGHFFYGNVTITETVVEPDTFLQLLYGEVDYLLVPTGQDPDSFDTIGNNELSPFINMGVVVFGRNGLNQVDTLEISAMESLDPPMFVRGLQMDDAPPPELDTC